jgi:hypothetical protein
MCFWAFGPLKLCAAFGRDWIEESGGWNTCFSSFGSCFFVFARLFLVLPLLVMLLLHTWLNRASVFDETILAQPWFRTTSFSLLTTWTFAW